MCGAFKCGGCGVELHSVETLPDTPPDTYCPNRNCGRPVWVRLTPELPLALLTDIAPDFGERFAVDRNRLLDNGRELLAGPPDELQRMARELNERPPAPEYLARRIRAQIQRSMFAVFQPGPALVEAGMLEGRRRIDERVGDVD